MIKVIYKSYAFGFMEQEDFCSAIYTLKKLEGYLFKAFFTHYFLDVEVDEYGEVLEY